MSGDFPIQLATGITSFSTSLTRTRILADLSDTRDCPREDPRSSRGCPLGMRARTRVHDKLSCARLQNYTICASLMSVSVSVQWNSSFTPAASVALSVLHRSGACPPVCLSICPPLAALILKLTRQGHHPTRPAYVSSLPAFLSEVRHTRSVQC